MTSYQELLSTPEWEKFRLEIIKSNNWACEHCKNNKIIKNYKRGNFYEASKYKNNEFSLEDGIFCFYVEFHSGIFSIRALHWTKDENFFDELSEDDEILFEHKSNYREFKTRIIGIKKGKDWVHVNNMHVHHTYYQKGLNPWEYPKESVQALCWDCHEELHKNTTIPYLDENGVEIKRVRNCDRCFGAGYLPEYNYYKNGICFKCNGDRFF